MQIVRLIVWLVLTALIVIFAVYNWTPVEVLIWDGIVLETKVPALVIIAFLLGFVPAWLIHYGSRWRMQRRIRSLENAAQTATAALLANSPPEPMPPAEAAPPAEPSPYSQLSSTQEERRPEQP